MKHFEEPLTVFAHDELLGTSSVNEAAAFLSDPSSFAFLDALLVRTRAANLAPSAAGSRDAWLDRSVSSLLDAVRRSREQFAAEAVRMRRAYGCIRLVQTWMIAQGYKTAEAAPGNGGSAALDIMIKTVKGTVGRDAKYLATMVSYVPLVLRGYRLLNSLRCRKLPSDKLGSLLVAFGGFLEERPPHLHGDELDVVASLDEILERLDQSSIEPDGHADDDPQTSRNRPPEIVELAEDTANLIKSYLEYVWLSLR